MREQHLARLKAVYDFLLKPADKISLFVSEADKKTVARFLAAENGNAPMVVFAPGARSENKRWNPEGFAKLADYCIDRYGVKVVLIGDQADADIAVKITAMMKNPALDLTGKLTLKQSGYLLSLSHLAVVNDSAPLHLASYLNVPVAAFFGPTDPKKYGPWGHKNCVIQKKENCPACCGQKKASHCCMQGIGFEDALVSLANFLPGIFDANEKR